MNTNTNTDIPSLMARGTIPIPIYILSITTTLCRYRRMNTRSATERGNMRIHTPTSIDGTRLE